jgi:hypothetical protein
VRAQPQLRLEVLGAQPYAAGIVAAARRAAPQPRGMRKLP